MPMRIYSKAVTGTLGLLVVIVSISRCRLAAMRIQRRFFTNDLIPGTPGTRLEAGFTVVEVLICVGIAAIILGLVAMNVAFYYSMTWTGKIAIAPPTARNGAITTYVYKVTGYSDRTQRINGTQRPVQFILAIPGPNEGTIASFADASGNTVANRLSINAITDASGEVAVRVQIDSQPGRQFVLTAIDTGPGCTGTACSEYATITVVQ